MIYKLTTFNIISLTCLMLISGCFYDKNTVMEYNPAPTVIHKISYKTLAVVPLNDMRPPTSYPLLIGRQFILYIPFIFQKTVPYSRLDDSYASYLLETHQAVNYNENFPQYFAMIIADDLRKSKIFSNVEYVDTIEKAKDFDYILEGNLYSTQFNIKLMGYLLGPLHIIPWLLEAPAEYDTAFIELEFNLISNSNGKTVWSYNINSNYKDWHDFYHMIGGATTSTRFRISIPEFGSNQEGINPKSIWAYYSAALRSGMQNAKNSLIKFLNNNNEF